MEEEAYGSVGRSIKRHLMGLKFQPRWNPLTPFQQDIIRRCLNEIPQESRMGGFSRIGWEPTLRGSQTPINQVFTLANITEERPSPMVYPSLSIKREP